MKIGSEMQTLVQDIASSHQARDQKTKEIKPEVKGRLKEARLVRQKVASQLRKDLARGEADRKQASIEFMEDLTKEIACQKVEVEKLLGETRELVKSFHTARMTVLTAEVKGILKEARLARRKMASQLRKDLARGEADRKQAGAQSEADRASVVKEIRAEVRADLKQAKAAWRQLANRPPTKKASLKVPSKAEAANSEEATVGAEKNHNLETRLLEIVNEHPDGRTLVEVAESLGVASVVLGRASKNLIEDGKIRKADKIYFPVTSN